MSDVVCRLDELRPIMSKTKKKKQLECSRGKNGPPGHPRRTKTKCKTVKTSGGVSASVTSASVSQSHKGQKVNKWKETNMAAALQEWKSDSKLSIRQLAQKWDVPVATFFKRTKKQDLTGDHLSGRNTILSMCQEAELADLLKTMSRRGFPLTKSDIQRLAYQYAEKNNISGFRSVGKAGRVWFKGFMKRHKDLRVRKPENLSSARAMGMNKVVVKSWFDNYLDIVNSLGIRDRAELFWNCDESGLQDQFDQGKAVGEVGKPCFRITPGEKGETTTMVAAFNAAGEFAAPMIIFKNKRIKSEWCVGSPPNTLIKCSNNGWITTELMTLWAQHFLSKIPDDGLSRILMLDGHITHTYNLEFLELMKSRNFEVICFPAHTTHWLQAADKSFFRSFKHQWNEHGKPLVRNSGGGHLSKAQFFEVFTPAWNAAAKPETAIAGFRGTGTWPVSFEAIPAEAFEPSLTTERPLVTASCTPSQTTADEPSTSVESSSNGHMDEPTSNFTTQSTVTMPGVCELPVVETLNSEPLVQLLCPVSLVNVLLLLLENIACPAVSEVTDTQLQHSTWLSADEPSTSVTVGQQSTVGEHDNNNNNKQTFQTR